MSRLRRGLLIAAAALTGCFSSSDPLETIEYASESEEPPKTLVIMLPGLGDAAEDFAQHGFVEELRASGVEADVVAVDAHFGYYSTRSLLPRLEADVLAPARAKGYESIFVVGISMGGFGAMLAARAFPRDIDGIVLLSPYLGMGWTTSSIADAGGVADWDPPSEEGNFTVELWRWIKVYETDPGRRPPMHLAYGDDEPGFPHAMLGEVLPPARVLVEPGEHGWTTWEKVWPKLLAQRPFDGPLQ